MLKKFLEGMVVLSLLAVISLVMVDPHATFAQNIGGGGTINGNTITTGTGTLNLNNGSLTLSSALLSGGSVTISAVSGNYIPGFSTVTYSAGSAVCWKAAGSTALLGYCSSTPTSGACTCN